LNLLQDIKSGLVNEENFDEFAQNNEEIYIPKNLDNEENAENGVKEEEEDFHPILTKPGYFTVPKISELAKYSYETLREIESFCIFNDEGMIEFEGLTDVTFVNMDDIVDISHVIEVYPDENEKPKIGQKLNKPAILTFHKCHLLKKGKEPSNKKIEAKLRHLAEKQVIVIFFYIIITFFKKDFSFLFVFKIFFQFFSSKLSVFIFLIF